MLSIQKEGVGIRSMYRHVTSGTARIPGIGHVVYGRLPGDAVVACAEIAVAGVALQAEGKYNRPA
jgi:hypothetical protein